MTAHRDRLLAGEYEEGAASSGAPAPALEDLTKAELLDLAAERGLELPANATKAEVRAALEGGS